MGTLTAGIKEIFSSAKTTGSNVMLCGNDGTPDGHMTMANLASVLGELDNIKKWRFHSPGYNQSITTTIRCNGLFVAQMRGSQDSDAYFYGFESQLVKIAASGNYSINGVGAGNVWDISSSNGYIVITQKSTNDSYDWLLEITQIGHNSGLIE